MCPVPGLVAPLPPPQCYGTPASHQKSHICMLFAASQSHGLPLAAFKSHRHTSYKIPWY